MSVPATERPKEPTPLEKTLQRTGRCVVCRCEAFELAGIEDGFRTCVCNHTQVGHLKPAVE